MATGIAPEGAHSFLHFLPALTRWAYSNAALRAVNRNLKLETRNVKQNLKLETRNSKPPSPARAAAFDILMRVEQGAFADELLHSDRLKNLSPQDRALTTELVMGVLRWRSRLDRWLSQASSQRLEKLDPEVLAALRLGAYQLAYLERVPASAAVNESVELMKWARRRFSAPFVNAVLRKLANVPQPVAPGTAPAALAQNYAHPQWLVERWVQQYGADRGERICAYNQQIPRTALRGVTAAVEQQLMAEGVRLQPGELLRSARLVVDGEVTKSRAYREGRVWIQDEASQLVALLVGNGSRLLDCCAAPGGKTAAMAERNPNSLIVAADFHPARAQLLRRRLGTRNVHVISARAEALPLSSEFDRILADVPCSGTGTLARNPEIKWRLKPEDLADLHARQVAILRGALSQLAPGGRLVYSTCSLEPEENEQVIEKVLSGNLRLVHCREVLEALQNNGTLIWSDLGSLTCGPFLRTLPGVHPCDGFFAAVIERAD